MRAKTTDGREIAGISTPLRDQDRPRLPVVSARLAKRVFSPMLLGRHLVDRDAVLEARAAGMRRRGEERPLGMMPAIDLGMRRAGDDRELATKVLEELQVLRGLVVAAGLRPG